MDNLLFENFNFEVINIDNPAVNLLTINKNSITFDRSIADCLNFASHVRPLLDRENRVFAIQTCRSVASKSIPFSKPETKQKGSIKISSSVVRNAIKMLMQDIWKEDKRYQLEGKFIAEHKAFIFDLNSFNELPPFKMTRN